MPHIQQLSPACCRPHRRGRGGRAPCERCQGAAGKRHRRRRAERDGRDEKRRHDLSSRQRRRLRHRAERAADGLPAPRDEQAAHGGGFGRHRHAGLSRRGARGDLFRFSARHFLARARRAQRSKAPLRGRRSRHGRGRGLSRGNEHHRARPLLQHARALKVYEARQRGGHGHRGPCRAPFALASGGVVQAHQGRHADAFDPRRRRAALRHLRLGLGREFTLSLLEVKGTDGDMCVTAL